MYRGSEVGEFRLPEAADTFLTNKEHDILTRCKNVTVSGSFYLEKEGYVRCSFHFPRAINRILDVLSCNSEDHTAVMRRMAFSNLPVCYFQYCDGDGYVGKNKLALQLTKVWDLESVIVFCNGGAKKVKVPLISEQVFTLSYFVTPITAQTFLSRCLRVCARYCLYFDVGAVTKVVVTPASIVILGDITTSIGNDSLYLLINERGYVRCNNVPVGYVGHISHPHILSAQKVEAETYLREEKKCFFEELKREISKKEEWDEQLEQLSRRCQFSSLGEGL
jgi:hypothetical protein